MYFNYFNNDVFHLLFGIFSVLVCLTGWFYDIIRDKLFQVSISLKYNVFYDKQICMFSSLLFVGSYDSDLMLYNTLISEVLSTQKISNHDSWGYFMSNVELDEWLGLEAAQNHLESWHFDLVSLNEGRVLEKD